MQFLEGHPDFPKSPFPDIHKVPEWSLYSEGNSSETAKSLSHFLYKRPSLIGEHSNERSNKILKKNASGVTDEIVSNMHTGTILSVHVCRGYHSSESGNHMTKVTAPLRTRSLNDLSRCMFCDNFRKILSRTNDGLSHIKMIRYDAFHQLYGHYIKMVYPIPDQVLLCLRCHFEYHGRIYSTVRGIPCLFLSFVLT